MGCLASREVPVSDSNGGAAAARKQVRVTCGGDSGAPFFRRKAGRIYGVLSGGIAKRGKGKSSKLTCGFKESIEAFEKGDRPEMAEAEKAELAIIQEFLPQLADAAQTRSWVEAAIASTGATEKKDMGKVMGALMKDHKADLDGNLAKGIVQELLS